MHNHEILTLAQIRNMIRPADPDNLFAIGTGVYRAEGMASSSPRRDEIYLRGMNNVEIVTPLQKSEIRDDSMFLCFRLLNAT